MTKNRSVLLIVVCLALGVLVFLDNWSGRNDVVQPSATVRERPSVDEKETAIAPSPDTEPLAQVEMNLTNPLASFDKSLLDDWVARPLFAPSRQRPPEVATAAPVATPRVTANPPPTFDLLGIVRDGARAIALLRKKGEGTSFRVEVGDMIGGWRVAKMEPSSVVLERADGTSQTVPLSRE